jgi:hypothetical protein
MRFREIGLSAYNVINSDNLERDMQMRPRNLHQLDWREKPNSFFRMPL